MTMLRGSARLHHQEVLFSAVAVQTLSLLTPCKTASQACLEETQALKTHAAEGSTTFAFRRKVRALIIPVWSSGLVGGSKGVSKGSILPSLRRVGVLGWLEIDGDRYGVGRGQEPILDVEKACHKGSASRVPVEVWLVHDLPSCTKSAVRNCLVPSVITVVHIQA